MPLPAEFPADPGEDDDEGIVEDPELRELEAERMRELEERLESEDDQP